MNVGEVLLREAIPYMEAILYVFACGGMLILSIAGLESAIMAPSLERWNKRFFIVFFSVLLSGSLFVILELVVVVFPVLRVLTVISGYAESLLFGVAFLMLAVYLVHGCSEDPWRSFLFRTMLVLWVIFLALLSAAQFTDFFYQVMPNSQWLLGPGYPLIIAPMLTMLLVLAVGVIRRRNKLSRRHYRAFLICLIPITLAMIVHLFIPVFSLIGVGLVISAHSIYRIIVSESIEQNLRQQREIASQRARIAVLQMRPHFIYNTMTSIYYLCDQNPTMAKKVTMDFTTYLRKNFNAIVSEDTIPFSDELEHTRAYLAVEQAQYEDDLLVDYETPHTQFRMPPLTLQPIVENAVKHGTDPDSAPLHIWVRTTQTNYGSEIVVEDDGIGYDPAAVDWPRTTLANIERRIEMMCGGTMSIGPREGGGTVVKVTIPKR